MSALENVDRVYTPIPYSVDRFPFPPIPTPTDPSWFRVLPEDHVRILTGSYPLNMEVLGDSHREGGTWVVHEVWFSFS